MPGGVKRTISLLLGSTVSWYWTSIRSSMRAPLSAIEPLSDGLAIAMRGLSARTAARSRCPAAAAGAGAAPGTAGAVASAPADGVCGLAPAAGGFGGALAAGRWLRALLGA